MVVLFSSKSYSSLFGELMKTKRQAIREKRKRTQLFTRLGIGGVVPILRSDDFLGQFAAL
jgi:hypothetical protein